MDERIRRQKAYPAISPDELTNDPAVAAERLGLIGKHSEETRRVVGAWRWPMLQKHRQDLMSEIIGKRAIDFGGAAGPIGYGAVIVDPLAEIWTLCDLEGNNWNTCIASHVLEHIRDVPSTLILMHRKLASDGVLVIQSPSWKAGHLRPETHEPHYHAFCASVEAAPPRDMRLDLACREAGFYPLICEVTDTAIFIVCRKP